MLYHHLRQKKKGAYLSNFRTVRLKAKELYINSTVIDEVISHTGVD